MRTVVIDAREMLNRDVAHSYLANKLSFPDYYAKNLDALHDCLTDMSTPTHIVLYRFSDTSIAQDSFLYSFLKVLRDSAETNKYLTLSYDVDSLTPENFY